MAVGASHSFAQDSTRSLSLLAFGDINLGRSVGQEILKENVDFPFDSVGPILTQADVVFANLESQLTDQGGVTQHPQYNLIFCGPPQGARSLKRAGITVVSTANNHAYDYRRRALKETIRNLREASVQFAGTNETGDAQFAPAVVERNGIRLGVVAYTAFVNSKKGWQGYISDFDSVRAKKEIQQLRDSVDVVVASYHGGAEYADVPDARTLTDLRALADFGADVVVAHHPHVPHGVQHYKKSWIFSSLGNFVFYQPQLEWTQKSFGARVKIVKEYGTTRIAEITLLPFRSSRQPSFALPQKEVDQIAARLRKLSNVDIHAVDGTLTVVME